MSCNSCAKGYTFLRSEKGCPGCGFSFCSKCLNNKVYLPKLKSEAKVCAKCKKLHETQETNNSNIIVPPDAYYKRLAAVEDKSIVGSTSGSNTESQPIDDQIQARLKKLKENNIAKVITEEEIAKRLQGIKGEVPSTSDAELHSRLAKLKGMPEINIDKKPTLPVKDLRTEQEQADDLMKQYLEETKINSIYQDELDNLIKDMELRMNKLKGTEPTGGPEKAENSVPSHVTQSDSEDEEESVRKIVEKIKSEATVEDDDMSVAVNEELPFCEICNEDANMRCLGCKYLFCKLCFMEHKDDDDGCNRYEPYQPPKGAQ